MVFVTCLASIAASSFAATVGGGGTTPFQTAYFENGNVVRSGETVQALGPDLMGDKVNEYNGALEFEHTDVSLPGNSSLPVMVGRQLATGSRQAALNGGLFGDWDLVIPHLHTVVGGQTNTGNWFGRASDGTNTLQRCSRFQVPLALLAGGTGQTQLIPTDNWWDGYHMSIPGVGEQTLLARNTVNLRQPASGGPYPVVTKDNWQLSCLGALANGTGEGFVAHAPDGSLYQFDHIATRAYPNYQPLKVDGTVASASRSEVWILPTQITDRFGNWIRYAYDPSDAWKVQSISSSDGRFISFTYVSGTHRIQTVFDGTRTWTYGYSGSGTLQSVVNPDGSKWAFALEALEHSPLYAADPACEGDFSSVDQATYSGTMVHPSGATGTFTHKIVWHGASNVPGSLDGCHGAIFVVNGIPYHNQVPTYTATYSLLSKTLSGPGLPAMTWSYDYGTPNGSFAPPVGKVVTTTVSTTDPLGNVIKNTYGTQYAVNDGLLLASSTQGPDNGVLQSTTYAYNPSNAGPYPVAVGDAYSSGDAMSRIYTPQSQRVINQQGVAFTQSVTGFDGYARPTGITKSSTPGFSKTDTTTYYDDLNLWVLGQVAATATTTTTNVGVPGQVAACATDVTQSSCTNFYASTALPSASYRFGKLQASYAFNADGTLSTVADGLNHVTTFSNYVRGLAQRINYADGTSMSAVVNNIGTLNSVTNEAGTSWTFTYDAMGRLSGKTPPGGDPVNYNPTTYSFVQVPTAEYGLEANHWRQSIAQGNAVTVNYFDARWRKRLTVTYDAANPGSTQRMQRFDYDPYNRTTFAAYAARSINSVTISTPGTATSYDALGRVFQTRADSELGTLTTNTAYLDGFQKRVTNPRGYATTTSYQAFDEPSESAITAIAAPEGVSVAIGRDPFDKPLSITRSGASVASGPASVTRSYVYDAHQLLCKTIEPEIGATVQSLDAANNVAWRATGLGLTDASSCNIDSVPSTSKVSYSYDARNRLLSTGFADGSPAISRTYTADGLAATVTSNNSTWTYAYNNRRLPTQESLAFGSTYNIGWGYDANAHVSQLTYPDNTTVTYSPNALGEATQVSGYASGITYQPNGAVAGYTLANGTVHSQTQNTRGLPQVNSDSGVLQDQYSYDANGNVTAIADRQAGITSRSMGYDGLDRLTTANAPGVWGNASYSYDGLDNLRTSTVGGRVSVHNYDAGNRLSSVNTNGVFTGYVYDAQGNITGRGSQGYSFDQGNRMTLARLASGVASYTYDGLGRRTGITGADGSSSLQVYSQSGQLLYGTLREGPASSNARYVYLAGKAIAKTSAIGVTTYLHTDALGSPVASVGPLPAVVSYSCPAGWTLAGSTCSQGTTNTVAATLAGYNCPSGSTLSGSTCSQTTGTTSAATVNYSCPSGWSLAGSSCTSTSSSAAAPVYACPSGYTLSGATCTGTATAAASSTLNCNGRGSLQAYAGSPTGYKCTTQGVSMKLFDDPYGQCQSIAASMGLPLVGTSVSGGVMTCVIGPLKVYACPSGQTLSGSSCTSTVTQAASIGSYTCSSGAVSGSSCIVTNTSAASVSYSCPSGQTLSGTTCTSTTTTTTAGTPYYSCQSGYTLSGATCTVQGTATTSATAAFSCPSGGTLAGSTCQNAIQRTTYEAYGNTAAGAVPRDIGFTGHVNDADTGLTYMQARYYDPIAARFLSIDPVTTDASNGALFNRFSYAQNNPYRYTDPDGRCPICVLAVPTIIDAIAAWAATNTGAAVVGITGGVVVGAAINSTGNSGGDSPAPGSATPGQRPSKTPNTGPPGSTYVNPGSGQERTYGPDGRPLRDVDHDHDHGQGVPHQHDWVDGERQLGTPIPAPAPGTGAPAPTPGGGQSPGSGSTKTNTSSNSGFQGVFNVGGRLDSAKLGKQLSGN